MQTLTIWLAILLLSGLPFALVVWLWKRKAKSRLDWGLTVSVIGALILLAFIATPWAMSNYYLRYVLIALFALAVYFSFRKVKEVQPQSLPTAGNKSANALKVAALFVLLPLNVVALRTYFYPVQPVGLSFPLSDGVYCVAQGGNSVLTNPFHKTDTNNQIEYALDIVKLNWVGSRAAGIYPQDLTSYAIYGATIYSPCDGEVIKTVDGIPDNLPGDTGHNPSNMIVIRCHSVRVTLAHMTSGSFLVQNGQPVR
jgi:uncharacterized membrane protein (UPF0136 family)